MSQLKQIEKTALDVLLNLSVDQMEALCYEIVTQDAFDAWKIAKLLQITPKEALCLMANPQFLSVFHNVRVNLNKFKFLGKSLDKLDKIVESEVSTDETVIKAITAQANILGFNKQQVDINQTISVEGILDKIGKEKVIDVKPLPGLE